MSAPYFKNVYRITINKDIQFLVKGFEIAKFENTELIVIKVYPIKKFEFKEYNYNIMVNVNMEESAIYISESMETYYLHPNSLLIKEFSQEHIKSENMTIRSKAFIEKKMKEWDKFYRDTVENRYKSTIIPIQTTTSVPNKTFLSHPNTIASNLCIITTNDSATDTPGAKTIHHINTSEISDCYSGTTLIDKLKKFWNFVNKPFGNEDLTYVPK